MKRLLIASLVLLISLLFVEAPVLAQQRGQGQTMFNPQTIETLSGIITRIDSVQAPRGRYTGIHLQLRMTDDTLPVHLGPAWYLEDQPFVLHVGDSLTVRGSRVTMQDAPTIIAAEVHQGDQSLLLRDETGRPLWRGQRRQR